MIRTRTINMRAWFIFEKCKKCNRQFKVNANADGTYPKRDLCIDCEKHPNKSFVFSMLHPENKKRIYLVSMKGDNNEFDDDIKQAKRFKTYAAVKRTINPRRVKLELKPEITEIK